MPVYPDRPPNPLEVDPALPLPPLTLTCASGFEKGKVDLWWSNPETLSANTKFNIVGVNIYRSFDSEFGPYHRMNALPIQSNYWRDSIRTRVVLREDVSKAFSAVATTDPDARWIFRTFHRPIIIQPSEGTACADMNVYVTIDGIQAKIASIISATGEVQIDTRPNFDVASQKLIKPVVPSEGSVVLASYRYSEEGPTTVLYQRLFYRVSTVATDSSGRLFETPIQNAAQTNTHEVEKLDWVWREAVRRNRFILQHGGERVKVFIRRSIGPKCGCNSLENKQPASDCLVCYGTGIIGGYDGPYDVVIAPDDAEKKINQGNRGRTFEHVYDTWTGPHPLLSQRDFIVKLNGDRYGIGPVRMPSNRGMQLQQHFSISHLDESDIRYRVPVLDTSTLVVPQTRYTDPSRGSATPMTTERQAIPDEREIRSRTVVGENYHRRLSPWNSPTSWDSFRHLSMAFSMSLLKMD